MLHNFQRRTLLSVTCLTALSWMISPVAFAQQSSAEVPQPEARLIVTGDDEPAPRALAPLPDTRFSRGAEMGLQALGAVGGAAVGIVAVFGLLLTSDRVQLPNAIGVLGGPLIIGLPVASSVAGITLVGAVNRTLGDPLEAVAASFSGMVIGALVGGGILFASIDARSDAAIGISAVSLPVFTLLGGIAGYQLTSNWRLRRMREQLTSPGAQLTWAISPTQGGAFAGVGLRF